LNIPKKGCVCGGGVIIRHNSKMKTQYNGQWNGVRRQIMVDKKLHWKLNIA